MKIVLELVKADQKALTGIQQKLNTWKTTGILLKFDTQAIGDQILFKIALKKEP